MGTTTDLLNGIAAKIAAEVTPTIVWNPNAVYTAGQTGVFMKFMPTTPDRVVVLTAVNQGNDLTMPTGQQMVQVRGRSLPNRPTDVDDLLDSIMDVLHGATNLIFGTVTVMQMNCKVSVPMGMDELKRWERVDQYYLDVATPPTALRPTSGN